MGTRDYKVGYGKPPKEHQFKPGESGNRRGRPIKKIEARNLFNEELCAQLNTSVFANEGGKRKRISVKEAIARRLLSDAMNGKISAIKYIAAMTAIVDADQQRRDRAIIALMEIEIEREQRRQEREAKKNGKTSSIVGIPNVNDLNVE
ncbi:hypothetical protein Dip510_001446 [Elusimicrobium posterum]|uniref:DUF5681 domain-containing protein n=1 Tax=Elusimicrobium posterum TaxID=3116653 RepID=UPI003C7932E7